MWDDNFVTEDMPCGEAPPTRERGGETPFTERKGRETSCTWRTARSTPFTRQNCGENTPFANAKTGGGRDTTKKAKKVEETPCTSKGRRKPHSEQKDHVQDKSTTDKEGTPSLQTHATSS